MCQAPPAPVGQPDRSVRNLAAVLCFVSVSSMAMRMPFILAKRDALGCGALCVGGMTSLRNVLALIGAPLVGRLSDTRGRRFALVIACLASLASGLLTASSTRLAALWLALVPSALLSHEFDALKAVLADAYRHSSDGLADAQGKLGMALGVGFVGVAAGLETGGAVALTSCVGAALSLGLVALLPAKQTSTSTTPRRKISLSSARSPPGLLLVSLRALMGLAFHIFAAIWQTSLKERFPDFGASDHAKFMTFVGLGYALSQGLIAQPLLKRIPHTALIVACCACLSFCRVAALHATTLPFVYAAYAPIVVALGVLNTALASAASRVADPNDTGGFVGLLSAVESICGVVGPALGGLLAVKTNANTVCALVLALYFVAATIAYSRWAPLIQTNTSSTTTTKKVE